MLIFFMFIGLITSQAQANDLEQQSLYGPQSLHSANGPALSATTMEKSNEILHQKQLRKSSCASFVKFIKERDFTWPVPIIFALGAYLAPNPIFQDISLGCTALSSIAVYIIPDHTKAYVYKLKKVLTRDSKKAEGKQLV